MGGKVEMTSAPPTFNPGDQLYKYQLVSKIGEGQYGQVWTARDQALNCEYAIKILKPGVPVDQRLREAQIGHQLKHNNLVQIHQADVVSLGSTEHVVIVAMDYLPNGSIMRKVNPGNFCPLPETLQIAQDVLCGLDYLHANGFFHNDIKPENILIGPTGQAMLTDYGIAAVSADGKPVPAVGAYRLHMAPEVISGGQISALTDLFQVGLTLYRLANGVSSLRAKQSTLGWNDYYKAVNTGVLVKKNDFLAHTPAALRRVILRAIDPDPTKRFQSALEMRRALEKLSFPGYWTVSPTGRLIGVSGNHEYRFVKQVTAKNQVSCTSYKKNRASGNETKFTRFCGQKLTAKQADALSAGLMKFVVHGS